MDELGSKFNRLPKSCGSDGPGPPSNTIARLKQTYSQPSLVQLGRCRQSRYARANDQYIVLRRHEPL